RLSKPLRPPFGPAERAPHSRPGPAQKPSARVAPSHHRQPRLHLQRPPPRLQPDSVPDGRLNPLATPGVRTSPGVAPASTLSTRGVPEEDRLPWRVAKPIQDSPEPIHAS